MADTEWGKRDSRGEWVPDPLPVPSPLFRLPWNLKTIARYLFAPEGFLWPVNLFFVAVAVISWLFFTPGFDRRCAGLRAGSPRSMPATPCCCPDRREGFT